MDEKLIFEIVVGTYEQFVLGYKFIKSDKENKLVHSFANHSHQGTVKSVAVSSKWLASSSSDETIHLYDLTTRKECGQLMEQNGAISCVCFTPDATHLLSSSEDGSIAVFRTGSWHMQTHWAAAHKGTGVTHIAIHPSGKLALSLGKDQTLKTWNLVKGRPAYTTNLSRCKTNLELVVWSLDGNYYAIPMNTTLELFSMNSAGVAQVYKFKTKVTAIIFISEKVLCVGEESGEVSAHCVETGLQLWTFSAEKRVRGLATYKTFLATGCSNGTVSVYKMPSPAELPKLVASANAGCRITCLTVNAQQTRKQKQRDEKNPETQVVERNGKLDFKETPNTVVKKKKSDVNGSQQSGISNFEETPSKPVKRKNCDVNCSQKSGKSDFEETPSRLEKRKNSDVKWSPRNQGWDVKDTKEVKR